MKIKKSKLNLLVREIIQETLQIFQETSSSKLKLKSLIPHMLKAAQEAYDTWDQSDPENDELNGGGICQDIAEGISDVLNSHGIDAASIDSQGVGDQHVWCIAKLEDGVYEIDIPPSVYERGGGYQWTKIEGVQFDAQDLYIGKLSDDPEDFDDYTNY